MEIEIATARSRRQLDTVRTLFREYEQFLQVDLCFQKFEAELAGLPGRYAPPDGALLLAASTHEIAGCVAMRKQADGICEMKRLYVKPVFLKKGLGKRLALKIIDNARAAGYTKMVLDTLGRLEAAMNLYAGLGFKKRAPYYHNPLPDVIYWELDLNDWRQIHHRKSKTLN